MANIILKFFSPAIVAMSRLRYLGKFSLIVSFFVIPIVILVYFWLPNINSAIDLAKRESIGIEYIAQVSKMLRNVQQHRGATNAFLSGDVSYKQIILDREKDIAKNIIDIDNIDAGIGLELLLTKEWQKVKDEWDLLNIDVANFSGTEKVDESFFRHTVLTGQILFFMREVSETSGLFLDPNIDSSHLAEILVSSLPSIGEYLGQSRATGMRVVGQGTITSTEKRFFINAINSTNNHIRELKKGIEIVVNKNPSIKDQLEYFLSENMEGINTFIAYVDNKIIKSTSNSIKGDEYWSTSTGAVDASFKLQDSIHPVFKFLLQERVNSLSYQKNVILLAVILAFALAAYFYIGLYISVKRIVIVLRETAKKMVNREFVELVELDIKDELAEVANSFNIVASTLVRSNQELENMETGLRETNIDLEKKVSERTRELENIKNNLEFLVKEKTVELENRLKDLEKFQQLTVGRELRMIELKKELEECSKHR